MSTQGQGVPAHEERPERSRNARAQARHRAKRKAYIDQLEQTVTKLQTAMGYTTDQVASLPPPLVKIRELEHEIAKLHRENEELRRLLDPDRGHRPSLPSLHDTRSCDRDPKRRKTGEDVYMNSPPNGAETVQRPPPLTIPPPPPPTHVSHHYNGVTSHNGSHHGNGHSSSLFALHAPAFQIPGPATPSSSSTSSPSFSQPTPISSTPHSTVHHRQSSISSHGQSSVSNHSHSSMSHHGNISPYTQTSVQYPSNVKVEEDTYGASHHRPSHSGSNYSNSFSSYHEIDSWQGYPYSSDRHATPLVR